VKEAKMQSDSEALGATLKPFNLQRSGAVLIACLAWFGVEVQLHFALIKKESIAAHVIAFFSYFTVETNILVALALTIFLLQPQAERFFTASVTSTLVVYVIGVGVMYERLLRHLWHPHRKRLFADMLLHDAVPFIHCTGCCFSQKAVCDGQIQSIGSQFFSSSIQCLAARPAESILIPSSTPPSWGWPGFR
jgi:hypothetical protein